MTALAGHGYAPVQMARAVGVATNTVRRWEAETGARLPRFTRLLVEEPSWTPVDPRSARERIAGMGRAEAEAYLLHLIEELCPPLTALSREPAPGLRLSPSEARILHLLDRRRGQTVARDSMLIASCPHKGDDLPQMKMLDVHVCRLRRKLAGAATPARIVCQWGVGHRLDVDEPFAFAWSLDAAP